jgi:pimeloyl-ACP methyl ester carboxylesterase
MASDVKGTENYVSRSDGKVYYQKVGQGAPVVFIHGAGGSAWGWREVVDGLEGSFTCYVVDMPGYDHSDMPQRRYTLADFADSVVDIMDHAGIAKVNVIGDHTGAMVAFHIARTRPERVEKMVLDGLPYWNKDSGKLVFERGLVPAMTDTTSYDVAVTPLLSYEESLEKNPNLNYDIWERQNRLQKKSRLWTRFTHEATTNYDMQEAGPLVSTPMLVVFGEGDVLRRGETRLREGVKSAQVTVVEGCPGTVHASMPEEFTRMAQEYLQAK